MPNFNSMDDAFITVSEINEILDGIEGLRDDLNSIYQEEDELTSQIQLVRSDLRHLDALLATFDDYN